MKHILIITLVLATTAVVFAKDNSSSADKLNKIYKGKKFVTSTEMFTIGSDRYLVQHWMQGGRVLPSTTNLLKKIDGVKANNPLQVENGELKVEVSELKPDAELARKTKKSAEKALKKDSKNFNKWLDDTKKAKSKSSVDMAEFYDSIIDLATNRVSEVQSK